MKMFWKTSKAKRVVASLAIAMLPVLLTACYPQSDSQSNAQLAAIQSQLRQIESRLAKLEKNNSSGEWVLWLTQVNRGYLGGAPTAQSAYPTKESCLKAAYDWSLPGGKVMGEDPYIVQTSTEQLTYRCLPMGVEPFAKR